MYQNLSDFSLEDNLLYIEDFIKKFSGFDERLIDIFQDNNFSIHDINISVENLNVPDLLPIEDNKESEESKEDINFEVVHRRNTDDPIDTRRSALANDNSQETPITCHLEQQNIPQQPRAEVSIAEIEVDIGSEESSNIN